MPIRNNTVESEVASRIDEQVRRIDKAILYNLSYVAEQVVNHARSLPSPNPAFMKQPIPPHQPNYIDWTANLRSSIGYVIARDGEVVRMSDFSVVRNGTEGSNKGRDYARQLAARFHSGYVLIVVAGMDYAFYVKKKGYDVIDSAELLAERLVPKMLKQLKLL